MSTVEPTVHAGQAAAAFLHSPNGTDFYHGGAIDPPSHASVSIAFCHVLKPAVASFPH